MSLKHCVKFDFSLLGVNEFNQKSKVYFEIEMDYIRSLHSIIGFYIIVVSLSLCLKIIQTRV